MGTNVEFLVGPGAECIRSITILQISSGGSYIGTAELQHPIFLRYISFLSQFIVIL